MAGEFTSLYVVKANENKGFIKKLSMFVVGVVGMLCAMLLSLTLVGIIFAIPLGVTSFVALQSFRGIQHVNCPNCDKKAIVGHSDEDYKCPRCKIPVVLNWREA